MALEVEDGTGKDDATSFVSRAEFIAYAAARGVTVADEDASDVYLVKAVDWLLTKCWKGDVTVETQALPFPRQIFDNNGALLYDDSSVPAAIKRAQMDLGLASKSGIDLLPNASGGQIVKREKIGPIETEYLDGTATASPTFPAVEAAIAAFTCGQGRFRTVRV